MIKLPREWIKDEKISGMLLKIPSALEGNISPEFYEELKIKAQQNMIPNLSLLEKSDKLEDIFMASLLHGLKGHLIMGDIISKLRACETELDFFMARKEIQNKLDTLLFHVNECLRRAALRDLSKRQKRALEGLTVLIFLDFTISAVVFRYIHGEKVLEIITKVYDDYTSDEVLSAKLIHEIGIKLFEAKFFDIALPFYHLSKERIKKYLKPENIELLIYYLDLFLDEFTTLSLSRRHKKSLELCIETEQIFRDAIDKQKDEKKLLLALARILRSKGIAFDNIGEFNKALQAYYEAESIYWKLVKMGEDLEMDLCDVMINVSYALNKLRRLNEALKTYTEAEAMARKHLDEDSIRVKTLLATILLNKGTVYDDLGRPEEGIKTYNEAEQIYRKLIKQGERRFLEDLSMVLFNKSVALAYLNRNDEALKALSEVEDIRRDLIRRGRKDLIENLGNVLYLKGSILINLGRYTDAISSLNEAEKIFNSFIESGRHDLVPAYATVLANKASANGLIGNLDEALRLFDEVLRISYKLSDISKVFNDLMDPLVAEGKFDLVCKCFFKILEKLPEKLPIYPEAIIDGFRGVSRVFYKFAKYITNKNPDLISLLMSAMEYLKILPFMAYNNAYASITKEELQYFIKAKDLLDFAKKEEDRNYARLLVRNFELQLLQRVNISLEFQMKIKPRNFVQISAIDSTGPYVIVFTINDGDEYKLIIFDSEEEINIFNEIAVGVSYLIRNFNEYFHAIQILRKLTAGLRLTSNEKHYITRLLNLISFDLIDTSTIEKARIIIVKTIKEFQKRFRHAFETIMQNLKNLAKTTNGKKLVQILKKINKPVLFSPYGSLYWFPIELLPVESPLQFRVPFVRTFSLLFEEEKEVRSKKIASLVDMKSGLAMVKSDLENIKNFSNAIKGTLKEVPLSRAEILNSLKEADLFFYSGHGNVEKDPLTEIFRSYLALSNKLQIDFRDVLISTAKNKFGVILASCESALLRFLPGTIDIFGLLPAFLTSGFKFVLAPLLPIEDRFASNFFGDFLEGIAAKGKPIEVLFKIKQVYRSNPDKKQIIYDYIEGLLPMGCSEELKEFTANFLIWMIHYYGDPIVSLK